MMADQNAWFKAVFNGDEESVSEALAAGFDANTRDGTLNTALHHATKQGHLNIMRLLVEVGAELNVQNDDDSTALHLAEKNIESIRILLEAGADPNVKNRDYNYPYYFAFYGSMPRELTELYIKHGANLMLFDA